MIKRGVATLFPKVFIPYFSNRKLKHCVSPKRLYVSTRVRGFESDIYSHRCWNLNARKKKNVCWSRSVKWGGASSLFGGNRLRSAWHGVAWQPHMWRLGDRDCIPWGSQGERRIPEPCVTWGQGLQPSKLRVTTPNNLNQYIRSRYFPLQSLSFFFKTVQKRSLFYASKESSFLTQSWWIFRNKRQHKLSGT